MASVTLFIAALASVYTFSHMRIAADARSRLALQISDELKIARYTTRLAPEGQARQTAEADARQRLAHQIPDAEKAAMSDYVIDNKGDREELRAQVAAVWQRLNTLSNNSTQKLSLE